MVQQGHKVLLEEEQAEVLQELKDFKEIQEHKVLQEHKVSKVLLEEEPE
jgi:hypothetical protein